MRAPLFALLVMASLGASAITPSHAQGRHDDRPHGSPAPAAALVKVPDGAIPLKDGGYLVIAKDGVTYHMDKYGKRVRMRDGQTMTAADGTRYMMKNDAVWRAITEKGTLHPSHQ